MSPTSILAGIPRFLKHSAHYPANTGFYLDAVFAPPNTVGVPSTCQPLLASNTFSIYHDTEFRETDVDIELCAPVKKMGTAKDPFCFRMRRCRNR